MKVFPRVKLIGIVNVLLKAYIVSGGFTLRMTPTYWTNDMDVKLMTCVVFK